MRIARYTPGMDDTRALMHELRLATASRARADSAAELARTRQAAAVRAALAAGVPVRDLVAATGLGRERIYQIRDGRRK